MTRTSLRSLAFLAIRLLSSGVSSAQAPDSLWTRFYGSDDYDRGESLVSTADGGFAETGYLLSSPTLDDLVLMKLAADMPTAREVARTGAHTENDEDSLTRQAELRILMEP